MEVESTRSNLGKRGPSWRARNPKLMETPFVGNVRTFLFRKPFSGEPFVQLWGIYFGPKRPPPASLFLDWIHLKKGSKLDCILSLPMYRPTLLAQNCHSNVRNSKISETNGKSFQFYGFLAGQKATPQKLWLPIQMYLHIYIYTYILIGSASGIRKFQNISG